MHGGFIDMVGMKAENVQRVKFEIEWHTINISTIQITKKMS